MLRSYIGKQVLIEISGRKIPMKGNLIDAGLDILVLHNGQQFLYIPLDHLQSMTLYKSNEEEFPYPSKVPFEHLTDISYRKILMNAKGIFTELFITGNQTVHGYITSIMNDFFVFYSPVYRSIFISMNHLKYLIPYYPNATPYSLQQDRFPLNPGSITLARTFDQQLRKLLGEFVVLNLGGNQNHIGLLKNIQNNMIELVTSGGESVVLHLSHIKTVHLP